MKMDFKWASMKCTVRGLFLFILSIVVSLAYLVDAWSAPAERAYIPNMSDNTVSVINTATNSVVDSLALGTWANAVAINPAGTRVYVVGGANVWVINPITNTIISSIAVGTNPQGVAVNPAGTRVYVTSWSSDTVSVIDTYSNSVIATITVGTNPRGIVVNPAGTYVYVGNTNSKSISVIDTATNTIKATIPTGYSPDGVAINPSGSQVYVAAQSLLVIDTATNSITANVPLNGTSGVAVNPAGTRVYVTYSGSSLSVIDTATNMTISTIDVGLVPWGVSVNSAGTSVYVAHVGYGNNYVSVVDTVTNTVIANIPVGTGSGPGSIVLGQFIGTIQLPGGTNTTLASSSSTSNYGISLTFTATVTGSNPTGTVTFKDGTITLGTGTISSGIATYTTSSLSTDAHLITAVYDGDLNNAPSTSSALSQTVSKFNTSTSISSSSNTSAPGFAVTFTATVTGSNPTGSLTFKDGTTTLGTATLSGGIATFNTSTLTAGSHSITAVYSGDTNNAGSSSSVLIQVVNQETKKEKIAKMSSPPDGFTLSSTSQKFVWNQAGADEYRLSIGTSVGAGDIYSQSQGTKNFVTVDNLPSNGATLYVRLSSNVNGTWQSNDYTYKAYTATSTVTTTTTNSGKTENKSSNQNSGNSSNSGNSGNNGKTQNSQNNQTTQSNQNAKTSNTSSKTDPNCAVGVSYKASLPNGSTGSMCLSMKKVTTPSGVSKLRGTATWNGFASTANSADGSTFTFAWENYENDPNSGVLYENDPAHGALFVLAYAFPSSGCNGGASFFAVIEAHSAASMDDLGSSISFTPLFGQICGTKITSLNSYPLTRQ